MIDTHDMEAHEVTADGDRDDDRDLESISLFDMVPDGTLLSLF